MKAQTYWVPFRPPLDCRKITEKRRIVIPIGIDTVALFGWQVWGAGKLEELFLLQWFHRRNTGNEASSPISFFSHACVGTRQKFTYSRDGAVLAHMVSSVKPHGAALAHRVVICFIQFL